MPRVPLTPENKHQQFTEYPRLKLDFQERALILCIEPEPIVEYRHVMEAPEIGPDGRVIKEEKKNQKGEVYEAVKKEFFGQHLCFGDFNVLSDKGVDPENCPTCAAALEEDGVTAPKPHYAMHVIKYATQPGGWTLRDPFNVECLAWVFSPTRLNTLIDIAADLEEGDDMRRHDLRLGPCENKGYQKYEIHIATGKAQWLRDEDRKQFVAQTYQNNQAEDLSTLIARRISKADALGDIQKVVERMAQVNNPGGSTQVPDLSRLQDSRPADTQTNGGLFEPTPSEAAAGQNFDPSDLGPAAEPVSEPAPAAKDGLKKMDLQDILAGL